MDNDIVHIMNNDIVHMYIAAVCHYPATCSDDARTVHVQDICMTAEKLMSYKRTKEERRLKKIVLATPLLPSLFIR